MEQSPHHKRLTNLDYLNSLAKGNQRFIDEMLKIFLRENPREVEMLEKGIQMEDLQMIITAAHKLRSTLPFVGLDLILEKDITRIEQIAISAKEAAVGAGVSQGYCDGDLGEIVKFLPRVKQVCEEGCLELKN